ncbi:hypothetical protein C8J55DRAFT_565908 [Lentinula edodes]|uniref:Uncharacterized protein n=1 Tax=Lentinula lateritia TaxID=40482 RepID=A0A9W8ZTR8_9AGAR|nr:hypothetical protein C8J55DRAFT_565908 [Lentinula edodes]
MHQIRDFFETHQQCYREEVSELKRCMDLERKAYHTRKNTLEDYIKLLERQVDAAIKSDDDYRKERVELQESLTKTRMQLEKSDRVLEVIRVFLSVAVPDYQPNFVHLLEDVTQARDLIEQRLQATN